MIALELRMQCTHNFSWTCRYDTSHCINVIHWELGRDAHAWILLSEKGNWNDKVWKYWIRLCVMMQSAVLQNPNDKRHPINNLSSELWAFPSLTWHICWASVAVVRISHRDIFKCTFTEFTSTHWTVAIASTLARQRMIFQLLQSQRTKCIFINPLPSMHCLIQIREFEVFITVKLSFLITEQFYVCNYHLLPTKKFSAGKSLIINCARWQHHILCCFSIQFTVNVSSF